jgi:hypothetical protein
MLQMILVLVKWPVEPVKRTASGLLKQIEICHTNLENFGGIR